MKKLLKILGIIVGLIILLLVLGAAYINFSPLPTYEVKAPEINVVADSAKIAEGHRLATMVCNQCHLDKQKLQGTQMLDLDPSFGKAWSANITQHPEHGIGKYTDGELAYLLRTGIKRNGEKCPPWMPAFPHLSDDDLHSVIAYLRSDAPELQPSDHIPPKSEPSFLTKFLMRVAFLPLPYPEQTIEAPPQSDKIAFGKYLATGKVECYSCHSKDFKTMDIMVPENSEGYFGGGNPLLDLEGNPILSANITMDKETGIGNWTEAEFIRAVKFGQRPDGTPIRYPMVPFGALTDEEASAIWAYLQTIPAITHKVPR